MIKSSGISITFYASVLAAAIFPTLVGADQAVFVPSRAGSVDGTQQNSDEFMWKKFIEAVSPTKVGTGLLAAFETWASDKDTFNASAKWPENPSIKNFQSSMQQQVRLSPLAQDSSLRAAAISVECDIPKNPAVGAFPTGSKEYCIAEEVRRNRAQFDYIVNNNLNTRSGLSKAFAQSFKVDMPVEALAVKMDWVTFAALLRWVPTLKNDSDITSNYYTTKSGGVSYAMVSMHVSSRQNLNWVWATFEHQFNPGRCDGIGCSDSFGATATEVKPNLTIINSQYGSCKKTQALTDAMGKASLPGLWENYCLKGSQVTFTNASGIPSVLGNSVIEGIFGNGSVPASSCISCHAYASFGPNGAPLDAAKVMLPFNPSGPTVSAALDGSRQYDFMWGVLFAP